MMSRSRTLVSSAATAAAALQLMAAAPAWAAGKAAAAAPSGLAAFNGYWEIDDSSRRANTQKPDYTPEGAALAKHNADAQAQRVATGNVVGLGTYICGYNGAPFIYTTSEPFALVVTKEEVVQVAERPSMTPRHFYTDGRAWPDLTKLPVSSSGYSIAHWEGEELVVETRGLPPGGSPGGGLKGPNTVMTERFKVVADGKRMTVAFSIADPAWFKAPFTQEYTYDRSAPHTYAFGDFCDPNEDNGKTVSNPAE